MALPQTPPKFTAVITGSKEYSIEINDANFETQAWKLPRYEGCQLFTTKLNKVSKTSISGAGSVAGKHYVGPIIDGGTGSITVPDKTGYGKTACVQKYSRNIYVGNGVIGMDNGGEDTTILNFPQFSYVQSNTYYTINDDGTITTNRLESKKDNFDERNGFYRAFYEDFPIGSDCKIVINDESIKTNLKDSYNVYFNAGQLKKVLGFQRTNASIGNTLLYQTASNELRLGGFGTAKNNAFIQYSSSLYNTDLLSNFYSGSLDEISSGGFIFSAQLNEQFFESFFRYKQNSNYIGDKRLFITFQSQSSNANDPSLGIPIRTTIKHNIPEGSQALYTNKLSEVSTIELIGIDSVLSENDPTTNFFTTYFTASQIFNSNQNYAQINVSDGGSAPYSSFTTNKFPQNFASGSFTFTLTDDSNPSLLINLPKNNHLQDGIGQKGFIIIPENIHPHVKKNLTYFLAKAGVPLGIDVVPALDNEFKKLR